MEASKFTEGFVKFSNTKNTSKFSVIHMMDSMNEYQISTEKLHMKVSSIFQKSASTGMEIHGSLLEELVIKSYYQFDDSNFIFRSSGRHTIRRFINAKTSDCPPSNEWIYAKNVNSKNPTLVTLKLKKISSNTYPYTVWAGKIIPKKTRLF